MKIGRPLAVGALVIALAWPGASVAQRACGVERWAVKTLTDPDTALIDTVPVAITVLELRALARPDRVELNHRSLVERTTYIVQALVVGWKLESDQDYHVVIADPSQPDSTMIVEVPSSACTRSRVASAMEDVRQTIQEQLGGASRTYRSVHPPRPATITGVGFFDFLHGQIGVAPNGIELHPILHVTFP